MILFCHQRTWHASRFHRRKAGDTATKDEAGVSFRHRTEAHIVLLCRFTQPAYNLAVVPWSVWRIRCSQPHARHVLHGEKIGDWAAGSAAVRNIPS
jgi:hypothetical protein